MMRLSLVSLALLPLVACGGDDDGGNNPPVLVDAAVSVDAPPTNSNCKAASSYTGSIDSDSGAAESGDGVSGPNLAAFGIFNQDPDVLFVDLWDGFGVFENGIAPGTYSLDGIDEHSYENCGACVILSADVVLNQQGMIVDSEDYMPTSGSMSITQVSGTLEFTLSNVSLRHVTFEETGTVPANDGCVSTLSNVSFSAKIDADALRSKNAPIRLRMQRVTKR